MLVYPPLEHKTDSETIFFIGSAREFCRINNKEVELVYEGNFCPVFDLNLGENIFEINIDGDLTKLVVTRSSIKEHSEEHEFKKLTQLRPKNKFSKICLDPGHGASARGTCSPKGVDEKDLNLALCLKIKASLEARDFEVVLTRDKDIELSLEDRVKISEENNCDFFLSIHHNAVADDLVPLEHHGISAHYYYEHSYLLAQDLTSHLAKALKLKNNGAIKQNLYVTRENTHSKAILLECGYLIHPKESELIVSDDYQESLALELADFLASYS